MDLQKIMNDRATTQAHYMDEELDITYRPAMITPAAYAKLRSEQDVDELSQFLAGAIVKWSLTREGEMVEPTAEVIKNFPVHLMRAVARALTEDMPTREVGNA